MWVSGFRDTVQTRGRSRLGEPGRLPDVSVGAISGLCAWLAFQSWVLIPRVVAVGIWAWALSRHSWKPWPHTQVEIIP